MDYAYTSLVDLLRCRAEHQGAQRAYVFLKDGESEQASLTYRELDEAARRIAVELLHYVRPGDRVVLTFAPGLDFISAFFGCLYAGVVAVPVHPPTHGSDWQRFEKIVLSAGASTVLTDKLCSDSMRLARAGAAGLTLGQLRYIQTDLNLAGAPDDWRQPNVGPASLAFLQYTSGSTGTPKGVMVSHGNLLHNTRSIQRIVDATPESSLVGWMPLYHDMGLIANVLAPLFVGFPAILMAPAAFIVRPVRWLEAIMRYGASISGGPNFAYEHCVRRVSADQMQTLDLRHWQVAFNGAEVVRASSLQHFADKFAPTGFRKSAFLSCYGLAESTLLVTGVKRRAQPSVLALDASALLSNQVRIKAPDSLAATRYVGAGLAPAQQLLIVDPETRLPCAAGSIGEIWVKGDSVAQGYWNQDGATQESFRASLAPSGDGPYLRTGDLGFLHEDELFVTGRLKDLIIIRGRNYYAHDIEAVAQQAHGSLRIDGAAAFAVDLNGAEELVIVHEVNRVDSRRLDADEVAAKVRMAVLADLGLPLHELVLIRQGSLPRTTSGKTRRRACREAYLSGDMDELRLTPAPISELAALG